MPNQLTDVVHDVRDDEHRADRQRREHPHIDEKDRRDQGHAPAQPHDGRIDEIRQEDRGDENVDDAVNARDDSDDVLAGKESEDDDHQNLERVGNPPFGHRSPRIRARALHQVDVHHTTERAPVRDVLQESKRAPS